MPRNITTIIICLSGLLMPGFPETVAVADVETKSFHMGLLHPEGVDLVGYSSEKKISNKIYRFYTFGFPSLAAIGFNYYDNYGHRGFTATAGVGIGSVAYTSAGYQWGIEPNSYFKLGAGYTTGIAYTGWYPVLSYEKHFDP